MKYTITVESTDRAVCGKGTDTFTVELPVADKNTIGAMLDALMRNYYGVAETDTGDNEFGIFVDAKPVVTHIAKIEKN